VYFVAELYVSVETNNGHLPYTALERLGDHRRLEKCLLVVEMLFLLVCAGILLSSLTTSYCAGCVKKVTPIHPNPFTHR